MRWRASLALMVLPLACMALSACADGPGVVNDREVAEIAANGANQTGLTTLTLEEWRSVGERACEAEAWRHDAAREMADDLNARYGPPQPDAMATVVWMAAVTACAEKVPDDAIKQGPPLTAGS